MDVLSSSQQSAGSFTSKNDATTGKKLLLTQANHETECKMQIPVTATTTLVELNQVQGSRAQITHSHKDVLIHYKRKRGASQSSSGQQTFCAIKQKKSSEVTFNVISQNEPREKCEEEQNFCNQQDKSSSFNYMLNIDSKEDHTRNVVHTVKEDIHTELIQSKINVSQLKPTTFFGFQNTPVQELDPNTNKFIGRLDNRSIDINVPLEPESDEIFQRGYNMISNFLDNARETYYFVDDITPSFRISDDVDDCANIIEEHELWRPVGMKDACYNKNIEEAKFKIAKNFKEIQSKDFDVHLQDNTNQKGSSSSFKVISIQCAQRDPQSYQMCKTPKPAIPDEEIVDLVTPEVQATTFWNHKQTCYSPWKSNSHMKTESPPLKMRKQYYNVPIVGRRLFVEEENYDQDSIDSKGNEVHFIEEKSPGELKIYRDSNFREQRNTMVNRTDDIYNTSLSLGTSSSFRGKENLPPKRVIQPSRYLSSPYECDDRGPIMQHELKMYEIITFLGDVEGIATKAVVNIDKTIATYGQLGNSMKTDARVESYL
ncbi:uncharacterized protein LOC123408256 [Hordeum vulgare subsp. vulgare]|uniref:uncharacterized protein LOC123408256 n=1 Tax=Hordeum vulgare subsp. vulgare TaxID=112509 RepID=UPI001D1A3D3C|nr:uncharacterized protein LOC123408256 [Hordeum vulgare subsp. vulgare]